MKKDPPFVVKLKRCFVALGPRVSLPLYNELAACKIKREKTLNSEATPKLTGDLQLQSYQGNSVETKIEIKEEPFEYDNHDTQEDQMEDSTGKSKKCIVGDTPSIAGTSDLEGAISNNSAHVISGEDGHTSKHLYKCNQSDYKATYESNRVTHFTRQNKLLYCAHCDYKCPIKSLLVIHMRVHTKEKPYSCAHCDYKTALKHSLGCHLRRRHTGEKPYSCHYCEYKTAIKSNLVVHTRVHTGEKPYSCNYCEYKAAVKSTLVVHMRVHTGEKPYSCIHCDYKCAQNGGLIRHMKVHRGE